AYPQQRIDEIDVILRELAAARAAHAELDRNYGGFIQQADRFFNIKNYSSARENYLKASEIKPNENYPKDKIIEIDQLIQQQMLDDRYRTIIVAADGFFRTQNYLQAKTEYEKALAVKSDEQYPKSQISKIDDILYREQQRILAEQTAAVDLEKRREDIAKMQAELDEQKILEESGLSSLYDAFIEKADAYFNDQQYNVSRAWYYKATDVKPEEPYPPRRISEINRILNGMLLSQRDREYLRFVNLGDSTFRDNQLAVARGWYNQALSQKPDEVYPKNQLTEIQRRVAERVAGQSEQQFQNYKNTANTAFEAQNYSVARFWYRKALELRPNDDEVKRRLSEISEALR
ncbi:MAG: hypothetical protein ABFS16_14180, partial [Bacteroidota bacterium]